MPEKLTIVINKGTAVYPRLQTPDFGTPQFPSELGRYKADVLLSVAAAKPYITRIRDVFKKATGKALPAKGGDKYPFIFEMDKETGEETGQVKFKIKADNKKLKSGDLWDRKPRLIDAANKDWPKGEDAPIVGSGSIMDVKAEMYVWQNNEGMSLQPQAVRVRELQEYSGGIDISDFENIEDGFTLEAGESEDADF